MKKRLLFGVLLLTVLLSVGCGREPVEAEQPPAIMVDGIVYRYTDELFPEEVEEAAILGYTTSYNGIFPEKDGETNFNHELQMPYAEVEGGIAVFYDDDWYLCVPMKD